MGRMDTTALIVPSDTLRLKLAIWESRLTYARETRNRKRIAECESAIADITKKIAAA